MREARPALAEALQLNEQRRNAHSNMDDLFKEQRKLDDEFTLRLQHLNKIAGNILDERVAEPANTTKCHHRA